MSREKCDKCKRPVIVARNVNGAAMLLDPAPVLIYWLDRADCGTLAQRADDVKYYAPHKCSAPNGSLPARSSDSTGESPQGGFGAGVGSPGVPHFPRNEDLSRRSPLAAFVRRRRREFSYTQKRLAQACGVSKKTIELIESDKCRINDDTMRQLAQGLGVTASELQAIERGTEKETDAA